MARSCLITSISDAPHRLVNKAHSNLFTLNELSLKHTLIPVPRPERSSAYRVARSHHVHVVHPLPGQSRNRCSIVSWTCCIIDAQSSLLLCTSFVLVYSLTTQEAQSSDRLPRIDRDIPRAAPQFHFAPHSSSPHPSLPIPFLLLLSQTAPFTFIPFELRAYSSPSPIDSNPHNRIQ